MKLSDKIIFNLAAMLVGISWCLYIFKSWTITLIMVTAFLLLINVAFAFFMSRKRSLKNISAAEMCSSFALLGMEETTKMLFEALPPNAPITRDGQYILARIKEKTVYIINNYKFANTSEDDIARAYRKAKQDGINEVYILSRLTERKTMIFAANLDINFKFPDKKTIRRYLIERNAMPPTLIKEKKKKPPINYKELLQVALDPKRIKYYFFIGFILFIMSFFTPLRLYYVIISTIPLILAALSAFRRIKE